MGSQQGKRVTDEQIFNLLRAGETERGDITALCDAHGVTVPSYCVWKVKYGKLTLDELRSARAIESRRAFSRHALVAVGLIVTLTAAGLSIDAWVSSPETVTESPHTTPARTALASAAPVANVVPIPPEPRVLEETRVEHEGYSVQLAAVPDVQEASGKLEQLTSAGYSAFMLPTLSGDLTLYRVRVGPFDSLEDAQDAVRRLKRDGYEGAWISK
jgi:septal ring-binding cell division protein DamX